MKTQYQCYDIPFSRTPEEAIRIQFTIVKTMYFFNVPFTHLETSYRELFMQNSNEVHKDI